jgi:hypothetical protein
MTATSPASSAARRRSDVEARSSRRMPSSVAVVPSGHSYGGLSFKVVRFIVIPRRLDSGSRSSSPASSGSGHETSRRKSLSIRRFVCLFLARWLLHRRCCLCFGLDLAVGRPSSSKGMAVKLESSPRWK